MLVFPASIRAGILSTDETQPRPRLLPWRNTVRFSPAQFVPGKSDDNRLRL
jgi:hypothetical protein